jgi:predicted dehydrogenase
MEKLKVGVLGLRRGMTHLRNFLTLEEAVVIGGADRFPDCRERAAELLGPAGGKVVAEFDDLLAMQPDAVVIASNGKLQVEHSIQAMEAGCHVLSEVPGADTAEELVRLRDCVQRTGKTYMLGENSCFLDFLRYWRKWLLEDRFGPVSIAEAEYLHYLPTSLYAPDGSRVSPSQAKAQGRTDCRPIWRADQPPIQYLTHDLGPLLEVMDDRCVSVTCRSGPWRCEEAPLRSDGQIALFQTAKGALIKIMVTLNTPQPGGHRYRLLGTAGTAEWFSYEGFCRRFVRGAEERDGWEKVDIGAAGREDDTSTGHGGTDLKLARHFTRAILDGKPAPIDVYRCLEYTLPGILANKSAELGGVPLSIPDLRTQPFGGTRFWEYVGLPEVEPTGEPYKV